MNLQATIIDVFKVVVFALFFSWFFCPTLLCSVTTQTVQSHNNLQLTLVL